MSHLGTRYFADRFADATVGLAATIPLLSTVLESGESVPDVPTIYNDVQHPRICSMLAPLPDDGIEYPCLRVFTVSVDYQDIRPMQWADSNWTTRGTLTFAAQALYRDLDTAEAAADARNLLRAMRAALLLHNSDTPDNRTHGGILFETITSVRQASTEAHIGDTLLSPSALMVTVPFVESVPMTEVL